MASLDMELRKLNQLHFSGIAWQLLADDGWKKLMAVVPKNGCKDKSKFSSDTISMIERASKVYNKLPSELFLEEWGTMGRKSHRPTLGYVLELLKEVELFRAADYIAMKILKGDPVDRPKCGPSKCVDISDMLDKMKNMVVQENFERSSTDSDDSLPVPVRNLNVDTDLIEFSKTMDALELVQPPSVQEEELQPYELPQFVAEFNETNVAKYTETDSRKVPRWGTQSSLNSYSSESDSL